MTVAGLVCLALAASACGKATQNAQTGTPLQRVAATADTGDSAVDPCKLLTKVEAETVLDNPGPPEAEDLGISKQCKYSRDADYLELSVDVLPNDKEKMDSFRAVYDPKDITQLPGVGDVAFEFFQNPGESRYQRRSIVVLKGSTRFTLNLYRKNGEVGEAFNAKFVDIARTIAGRL